MGKNNPSILQCIEDTLAFYCGYLIVLPMMIDIELVEGEELDVPPIDGLSTIIINLNSLKLT